MRLNTILGVLSLLAVCTFYGASGSPDSNALAELLSNARDVQLRLHEHDGDDVYIEAVWNNKEFSNVQEMLKFRADDTSSENLVSQFLEKGDVNATLFPTENVFSVSDNQNGVLSVSSLKAASLLLEPVAPTLCADVRARAVVQITANGQTVEAKAAYSFHSGLEPTQERLNTENGRTLQSAIRCEKFEHETGCRPQGDGRLCVVFRTRPKFRRKLDCVSTCTKFNYQKLKVRYEQKEDTEGAPFFGTCKSVDSKCECVLPSPEEQAMKVWMEPPHDECTRTSCGLIGGDPHFSMWHGARDSYHGGCDLVVSQNPEFASGLGLDLHIRTQVKGEYSIVSNAALQIGNETLEVVNNGRIFVNHHIQEILPLELAGYRMFRTTGSRCTKTCADYEGVYVDLGNDAHVEIAIWRKMLYINVAGNEEGFSGTAGVMGGWEKSGFLGRDGITKHGNFTKFMEEWQVRENEPKLFHIHRTPQHPDPCHPPALSESLRRLRKSHVHRRMASDACAHVEEGAHKDFCLFDVMMTGDAEVAAAPFYGGY